MKKTEKKNILDVGVGDTIIQKKTKRKYLVIGYDSDCGGHVKICVIRLYKNWKPTYNYQKIIWDDVIIRDYELK